MEHKDPRLDPSVSTAELIELSRKQNAKEAEVLREELRKIDHGLKVKCDYLRNNTAMCTLEALQVLMDIVNSGEYTITWFEDKMGVDGIGCYKGGVRKMLLEDAFTNIVWVVKTHYKLEKARREQEEVEEFVSKLTPTKKEEVPIVDHISDSEVIVESNESEGNDDLGRDPMRWLFFELRRRGYIKKGDDTSVLRNLSELTGHSYRQIYKNKNEELTSLAKRRMIEFFEELIEKLNK